MKKLLLTLAMLLCFTGVANAQLSVVQRVNNNSGSSIGSLATGNFPTNPVSGRLIVVLIQTQGTDVASVTDTIGNTYTATTNTPATVGTNNESIFYTVNGSTAVNSVTATFNANSSYSTVTAYEVSGNHATPYIADDVAADLSSTTITTAAISVGGGTAIIFAIFESDAAGNTPETPTPFTGYTFTTADALGYIYDGYHVASADEAAGATVVNSGAWAIIGASFAQGAVASSGRDRTLRGVGQ